jgi:formylglycine-generating enzyme required for sulfatase activity
MTQAGRVLCAACISLLPAFAPAAAQDAASAQAPQRYTEKIPGTLVSFEMIPVPGGTVRLETPSGVQTVQVAPFWIMNTETTWDLYDVFVYRLDRPARSEPGEQAVTRPTRPYVLPGDAFGHEGMPALGMSFHAANEFARWISSRTGKQYRVPTEAEWEHACQQGLAGTADLASRAWFRGNAAGRTHPVGSKGPDALGAHDLLGNVAEWVRGFDADSVVKGGAWNTEPAETGCGSRKRQTPAWNETDPQLPKSRWWLPDATFVGVRLIRTDG